MDPFARKRRRTYNILVENLPRHATEKEVSKKFTIFGEIQHISVRQGSSVKSKSACIKFLCEPDARKAVQECNGLLWNNHIIFVQLMENKTKNIPMFPVESPIVCPFFKGDSLENEPMSSVSRNLSYPEQRVVLCTYVENAVTFYGQCTNKFSLVERVTGILQRCCPLLSRLRRAPDYTKQYAAVYSGDSLWYRCKILNNKSHGKSLVHFIDYGNSEEVAHNNITELPDSLKKHPSLAPKCVISFLTPIEDKKSKSVEAVCLLQETMLNRNINITTTSPDNCDVYFLSECNCDGQDIPKMLLDGKYVQRTYESEQQRNDETKCQVVGNNVKNDYGAIHTLSTNCLSSESSPSREKGSIKNLMPAAIQELIPAPTNVQRFLSEKEVMKSKITILEERCKMLQNELVSKENELARCSVVQKMESVASYVQLVNSIRSYPPKDQNCISDVFPVLQAINCSILQNRKDLENKIDEVFVSYNALLKDIVCCQVKEELENLIAKKNEQREALCKHLSQYVTVHKSTSSESNVNILKESMKRLSNKQKTIWDLSLSEEPSSLEELKKEYEFILDAKMQIIAAARQRTDDVHRQFIVSFSQLQQVFDLCPVTCSGEPVGDFSSSHLGAEGIFSSDSFKSSLSAMQRCLESEISATYKSTDLKNPTKPTVVEYLIKEIESLLSKLVDENQLFEKYSSLLKDLSSHSLVMPNAIKLAEIKKQIKSVKSKLRHKLADRKDLEETDVCDQAAITEADASILSLRNDLHHCFVQEDEHLKRMVSAYENSSPELDVKHPEFGLARYAKTQCILKQSWEADHFSFSQLPNRTGICYESTFSDQPVIIKEFLLENENKSKQLLDRTLLWNSVGSKDLVPVLALFQKSERQMCVMTPRYKTIEEVHPLSECCYVILAVLRCLETLHAHYLIHGLIHLSTVFVEVGSVKLDFCFDIKHVLPSSTVHGICFQAPELARGSDVSEATDMFTLGCFALSVLFPELCFSSSFLGIPDITVHRSAIEEKLSSYDYSILQSLIHSDASMRPPAKALLKSKFLSQKSVPSPKYLSLSDATAIQNVEENANSREVVISEPVAVSVASTNAIASSQNQPSHMLPIGAENCEIEVKDDTLSKIFALRESMRNIILHEGDSNATNSFSQHCSNLPVVKNWDRELDCQQSHSALEGEPISAPVAVECSQTCHSDARNAEPGVK